MSGLTESHVSSKNNPVGSFIEATLNYFADASEKPVIYTYEPSPGVPRTTGKSETHLALIRNAHLPEELSFNQQHQWSYFSRLERNKAILLKCYDSKEDGQARFSAHSAFDNPTSPPDAAPRASIEVRALVFWSADQ